MIKQNKPLKQYFGRSLKSVGLAFITASIFVGGCKVAQPKLSLPSEKAAMTRLMEVFEDKEKMYLLKENKIFRLPYKEAEAIKVNLTFAPTPLQQVALEGCIAEYNNLFSMINANYQFQINFSPTQQDLLDPQNIDVEIVEKLENSSNESLTVGNTSFIMKSNVAKVGGGQLSDNIISLPKTIANNFFDFTEVFKHEFAHTLGLGDAYQNPNAPQNTIMQSASGQTNLTSFDVATLDALYRSPNNTHSEEEINTFIKDYESTTTHTAAHTLSNVIYEKLADVNLEAFKKNIHIWYSGQPDIVAWKNNLSSLQNLDTRFGSRNCSFAQIKRDGFSYFPHLLNHFQISNNKIEQNTLYSNGEKKSYSSSQKSANGFIFLINNNKFYFNVDGIILNGSFNSSSAEITSIEYDCIYAPTTLTAEAYFDSVLKEETSTKSTQKSLIKEL